MTAYFDHLIGNDHVKANLQLMFKKKAVGNSLLFAGPHGVGKGSFALAFAQMILETHRTDHPDLHHFRPEGKAGMHSIESLRTLNTEVFMPPYQAARKVFMIHDAERMAPTSANALLKTFEEPTLDSVIILVSSSPESLISTIKSRCRTVRFFSIEHKLISQYLQEKHALSENDASLIAHLSKGSLSHAIRLAENNGDKIRHAVIALITKNPHGTYKLFLEEIRSLCSLVTESEKDQEETEDLSAIERHALEKEAVGLLKMKQAEETNEIFETALSWYRDIQLIQLGGDLRYLSHPDYQEQLVQAAQMMGRVSLDAIHGAIKDAQTLIERSTSLNICLESFFLKSASLK